jgi:site-specific recombinase XerD
MPRRRRRLPSFFRQSEIDLLFATADRLCGEARGPKRKVAAERNRLILLTVLNLGLRVSELCKLNVPDVDFDAGHVLILLGKGGRDRVVPIPEKLQERLRAWIGERKSGPVFQNSRGGKLSSRAVQSMCEQYGKAAGLSKKLKPHGLRHTYATMLLERGATIREVQELLGHSSVATTEIYCGVSPEHLRKVVNLL